MKQTKQYQSPAMERVLLSPSDIVTVSNGDTLVDISGFFGEGKKWGNIF